MIWFMFFIESFFKGWTFLPLFFIESPLLVGFFFLLKLYMFSDLWFALGSLLNNFSKAELSCHYSNVAWMLDLFISNWFSYAKSQFVSFFVGWPPYKSWEWLGLVNPLPVGVMSFIISCISLVVLGIIISCLILIICKWAAMPLHFSSARSLQRPSLWRPSTLYILVLR